MPLPFPEDPLTVVNPYECHIPFIFLVDVSDPMSEILDKSFQSYIETALMEKLNHEFSAPDTLEARRAEYRKYSVCHYTKPHISLQTADSVVKTCRKIHNKIFM